MAVESSSVAGIIAGRDPLDYDPSNPITVFLFQAIFIILLCQIVHIPLGYLKQPRVIAEVISGILLGPSVMGHIPGFTNKCFPDPSIAPLTLVANVGVILFLFLVGLEVDIKFIKKNLKIALSVGLINMAVPFGFGCIIAIGLYNEYSHDIKFTTFMVFIAVAMCITAFPVLARILTELRLLKDRVGTIVLAAGITNDVVGWMLLALSVTLANSGSGITTLYILLVVIGWTIFIIFPVRIVLHRFVLRNDLKTGNLSRLSILTILLLVFVSSFFTDIIGAHPIFGAFLVGLIVPREHGFVLEMTEKIEDLVHIVFIPIYFALAGFKVNLGDLSTGKDWGYVIALIVIAVLTKVFGGFIGAKISGLYWRESLTVGVLMSCKGIVEVVVLTVGLNANIISDKLFSMFVLMTLVSTFLTTPMTLLSYPVSYREKVARYLKGEIDWDGKEIEKTRSKNSERTATDKFFDQAFKFDKVIYNIESIEGFVTLLNFIQLFYGSDKVHEPGYKTKFNAIFLKQLTERTADLITASTVDEDKYHIQLELLRKVFEFNEVPYVGDLKYYIGEDKLETYLETSDNDNDFLLYVINKEEADLKLLKNFNHENIISHFAILYKALEQKIQSITIKFGEVHEESNSLMLYLAQLFVINNSQLNDVKVWIETDGTIVDNYIEKLLELTKCNVIKINKQEDISGLFISKLDTDEFAKYIELSHEQETFDILNVYN